MEAIVHSLGETIRHFILTHIICGETSDESLPHDIDLKKTGILDSLSALKLISFLEDQFSIEFEVDDIEEETFSSLASIERLVQSKLNRASVAETIVDNLHGSEK